MTESITIDDREELLKHLKRAGHDQFGESHIANKDKLGEPGVYADLVMDVQPCYWGQWFLPKGVDEDDKGSELVARTQCSECTCGYSDLLNLFEPGKEEAIRQDKIDRDIWVERSLENREHNMNQIAAYLIANDPDWAIA